MISFVIMKFECKYYVKGKNGFNTVTESVEAETREEALLKAQKNKGQLVSFDILEEEETNCQSEEE
jgi:hypothetical protein